jgi:hypothetical protein
MDILCKFEHLGRTLEIATVEEEWPMAAVPGLMGNGLPAPAQVTLEPITLSAEAITPADSVTLSAQVGGQDVAFVYLELLLRDPNAAHYYGPVCREPIAPPRTRAIGGVQVPDWREARVAQITVRPFLRLLTDGREWALGFIRPRTPKSPEAGISYTLEALYRSTWGRKRQRAQVQFDGTGKATGVLVFRELSGGAAPRSVNPRRSDQLTPLLRLYRPAGDTDTVEEKALVQGNALKWRSGLQWQAEPLLPGTYLAGLAVEDLDGQLHRRYAAFVVTP